MFPESPGGLNPPHVPATANDRFKGRWNLSMWSAMGLAVVFHAVVLFSVPKADVPVNEREPAEVARLLRMVNMAELSFTSAPLDEIPMPELPTMADLDLEIDMMEPIGLPEFSEFATIDQNLSPPIRSTRDEWLDYKSFAPYVVRPEIRNREELSRFLQRNYQRIYEYSGDTGVVQVTFWINEGGAVEKAEIVKSSGSRSLDRLALRMSKVFRFRPAMMAGRPIRILVHVPITFRAA